LNCFAALYQLVKSVNIDQSNRLRGGVSESGRTKRKLSHLQLKVVKAEGSGNFLVSPSGNDWHFKSLSNDEQKKPTESNFAKMHKQQPMKGQMATASIEIN